MSLKYLLINLTTLGTGLVGGYYTTYFALYAPKKEEPDIKIMHIS